MLLPLFPAHSVLSLHQAAPAPMRLTDAAVGRREYAVEFRLKDKKGETMTESATVAERIVRHSGAFRRTRYVVASLDSDDRPTFIPGRGDRSILDARGTVREGSFPPVPFADLTFPDAGVVPETEWSSKNFGFQRVRLRYEGETTVAGRPAFRISLREIVDPWVTDLDEGYVILDRRDLLPLQMYFSCRSNVSGGLQLLFRLRRANVPGLALPHGA